MINIVAMIIFMVALIALINILLGVFFTEVTLQGLLGLALAPVVWLLGVPWHEAPVAGELFVTKTVVNEFAAYLNMAQLPEGTLSERS